MALGALIVQGRFRFPDRQLVEQITENLYLQYFIGLPGYCVCFGNYSDMCHIAEGIT